MTRVSGHLGDWLQFRNGKSSPERTPSGKFPVFGSNGEIGRANVSNVEQSATVIGRVGSYCGSTWYSTGPAWVTDNAIIATAADSGESRFWYYALRFLDLNRVSHGSGQPLLNQTILRELPFTAPAPPERLAIAATLGALDDKVESNRRTISMIDELVRARFQTDFDMSQAADGVSVADLVPVNRKLKLSRGKKATYIGMSSLPEFSPEILDWESREFGSGQKFVNGDVLMARITPCLENGKTAIVDMLEDGEVGWGSTEYVVLSPKGLITTPWIYALARHELVREWAIRRMTGTSGRQRFQAAGFSDYRIAEPDQKRLEEFNSFAVPLFNRITQLRNEIRRLTSLRDTLLPELLSGRVSMPVGEVAS